MANQHGRQGAGRRAGRKIPVSPIPAVNVASVPQRSPLRYPGGKTWLIPHIRAWLSALGRPRLLVEPFAGGGTASLTAVMENRVERCLLAELDPEVAAFWHAALKHGEALVRRVEAFHATRDRVEYVERHRPRDVVEHGFRTLVLNRTRRGGVLAPGASLTRHGENGNGVASRWYPQTLVRRLRAIGACADRIAFNETDGMALLSALGKKPDRRTVLFVDPPYTAGGKRAGKRLYAHHSVDHARLFALLDDAGMPFLMTYDRAPEVEMLITKHNFCAVTVAMKSGHHRLIPELLITPRPIFI